MSHFYIVDESEEDTLATAETLENAVRFAKEAAQRGPVGDPVSILESGGQSVAQFLLLPDGTVEEQSVVRPEKPINVPHG